MSTRECSSIVKRLPGYEKQGFEEGAEVAVENIWLTSQIWFSSRRLLVFWLADKFLQTFLQALARQRIHPELLSIVTTGVVFRCHIAPQSIGQVIVETNDFVVPFNTIVVPFNTNVQLYGSHGNIFY